ncbi:hypothetical protein NBRC116594_19870 [Shimia sp. NS0008-38b]|uniref:DUF4345 domain-containing protein n=1 Tax=Shimia sp. NS0008-38b TaxID=3127653 RepID=UPI003105B561
MTKSALPLRLSLAVIGAIIVFLGLDVVLGGMRTMGWMGPTTFIDVADPSRFAIQDNHVRFLGGVWTGLGLVFVAASVAFHTLRITLLVLCATVVLGGLSRLTTPEFATLLNMSILPSLIAELVLFPLLALWIFKAGHAAT